jgi:hypothetical protein
MGTGPKQGSSVFTTASSQVGETNLVAATAACSAGSFYMHTHTHTHQLAHMQLLPGEATGTIIVSVAPQSMGQITYASQEACRLFGYTRGQLERREVSVLTPSPIAEAHNNMLSRYVTTGQSTILDRTRILLGVHKSGHLIPVCTPFYTSFSPLLLKFFVVSFGFPQLLFRLRDIPPGESDEGGSSAGKNSLLALVRGIESQTGAPTEERLLATDAGVITSGTLGALQQLCVAASVSQPPTCCS